MTSQELRSHNRNDKPVSVFIQTVQASCIKVLFDSLKDILTDVNIHFTENNMWLKAMDSSHVALIYLSLESEHFETFICNSKDIVAGVVADVTAFDPEDGTAVDALLHHFPQQYDYAIFPNLLCLD